MEWSGVISAYYGCVLPQRASWIIEQTQRVTKRKQTFGLLVRESKIVGRYNKVINLQRESFLAFSSCSVEMNMLPPAVDSLPYPCFLRGTGGAFAVASNSLGQTDVGNQCRVFPQHPDRWAA